MSRVLLIGIDGATFEIIRPLVEAGSLPTFSKIMKGGIFGELQSTFPANTLPAWTSILTGVNPGAHGISDFFIKENNDFTVAKTSHRMVPSLWEILTLNNVEQVIVGDPVTYPPTKVKGVMLTGFRTPYESDNFVYPEGLRESINGACEGYQPDLPLNWEKEISTNKGGVFEMINEFADKTFKAMKYLMKSRDWKVAAVFFTSTDRLQHYYYNTTMIKDHYVLLDSFIKEILDLAHDSTVIVVSDHGFGKLQNCFYVNRWLLDSGFVREANSLTHSTFSKLGLNYHRIVSVLSKLGLYEKVAKITPSKIRFAIPITGDESVLDQKQSEAFAIGLNSLYLNHIEKKRVEDIKNKLLSFEMSGEHPIRAIHDRNEVISGTYSERSPNIFIEPEYGYEISQKLVSEVMSPPSRFGDFRTGTHRPNGIFMAYGNNICSKGETKSRLRTEDITPTILHILGLPIPGYVEGRVITEIFENESEPSTRNIASSVSSEKVRILLKLKNAKLQRNAK